MSDPDTNPKPESPDPATAGGDRRPSSGSSWMDRLVFGIAAILGVALSPVGTCIVASFQPDLITLAKVIGVQVVVVLNLIVWASVFE
jgi:hypothetical protein